MEKALAAWLLLAAVSTASTPGPTEVIQGSVEQVLKVVQDTELARPAAAQQRRLEIRQIVEHLLDLPEIARRSLGSHWEERTSREREDFVRLFARLLERSYLQQLESYSGERIVYTGERVNGEFATVHSKIIARRHGEIPIDYRLHLVDSRWAVYDIHIEGVSFVSIYRSQFHRVIQTSSYDDLIEKMRRKGPRTSTFNRSVR